MSLNRYNPRRDENEPAIIEALEASGCYVRRLSGRGILDLLCGLNGRWFVVEVKMPSGVIEPAQEQFFDDAKAHKLPAFVCRSEGDVARILELL